MIPPKRVYHLCFAFDRHRALSFLPIGIPSMKTSPYFREFGAWESVTGSTRMLVRSASRILYRVAQGNASLRGRKRRHRSGPRNRSVQNSLGKVRTNLGTGRTCSLPVDQGKGWANRYNLRSVTSGSTKG